MELSTLLGNYFIWSNFYSTFITSVALIIDPFSRVTEIVSEEEREGELIINLRKFPFIILFWNRASMNGYYFASYQLVKLKYTRIEICISINMENV